MTMSTNRKDDFELPDLITDGESMRLILALGLSSPDGTFDEDDAVTLVAWANMARSMSAAVDLILQGLVDVEVRGEDVTCRPIKGPSRRRGRRIALRSAASDHRIDREREALAGGLA